MRYLYLFIFFSSMLFSLQAQVTLFEDSFETYDDFTIENFGDWVMHDVDGTPTWGVAECNFINEGYTGSAIVFNPSQCTEDQMGTFDPGTGNYAILTGEKYMTFWCAIEASNDNYLVSPKISLFGTVEPVLSFWSKSLASATNGFDPEYFEVLLSTTGNEVEDFVYSLGEVNEISLCCNWNEYTYNLDEYEGEEVYIAIHHISGENTYALHIDDFKVSASAVTGVNDYNSSNFSCLPNPFENEVTIVSDEQIEQVEVYNVLGQKVLQITPNNEKLRINTTNLSKGVYSISVKTKLHAGSVRMIKN